MREFSKPAALAAAAETVAVGKRGLSKSLSELARYGVNCGLVLALKLFLTWLLIHRLSASLSYLIVHVVIFFVSYALHSAVTFKVGFSWANLRKYFAAVAVFKLLDYCVYRVLLATCLASAVWCVFAASLADLIVRFLVARSVLRPTCKAAALGQD